MQMHRKLTAGEFLILAEMEPPKGVNVSAMLAHASKVRGRVDAFVVPEMSNAVMRMSSLGGAVLLQNKGFETVMQLCCRDRNRLALQADLLAAQALGVTNVMVVTGEDPSYGDHHRARAVYDIDLLQLLGAIQQLQKGRDMAGIELNGSPNFLVGSRVNCGLTGGALDQELAELDEKLAAGAQFFLTPPVFDLESHSGFMKKAADRKARIIPTVLLLKSVGMARYIDRHIGYVHIPPQLITRIQKAPDKPRECIAIAVETIAALREMGCSGVQIATLGWEDKLLPILDGARV